MARRRYRKRQIRPQETLTTFIIALTLLAAAFMTNLPGETMGPFIVVLACFIVLSAVGYYYLIYRKLAAKREGLRQLHIDDVDNMSGVAFEEYVAELFRLQNYTIQTTAVSGDYGVDLIVVKDGIRIAVQAKRYSKPVNQVAIREAVAGMKHYKRSQSMVITNNYFTKFAVDSAATNDCTLIDRDKLVEMIAARDMTT